MSRAAQLHRRALRILLHGRLARYPSGPKGRALRKEMARFNRRHASWLKSRDLEGFGIGGKITARSNTGCWSLIVYVRRKIKDRKKIARPVPKKIRIPTLGTFVTDVVELGEFEFHSFPNTIRPVQPGCCIGLPVGGPGTLGCLVQPNGGGPPLLLTCAHVLTNRFREEAILPIEQTARAHQTAAANYTIGTASQIVPVVFTEDLNDYPNEVDAGVATLDPTIPLDPTMRINGLRPSVGGVIAEGVSVRKVGYMTDETNGVILNPYFCKSFYHPDPAGVERRAGFQNLVLCSYQAAKGDSGSAVLDDAGNLLGVHMGGWPGVGSVFCRFDAISVQLGVTPL